MYNSTDCAILQVESELQQKPTVYQQRNNLAKLKIRFADYAPAIYYSNK